MGAANSCCGDSVAKRTGAFSHSVWIRWIALLFLSNLTVHNLEVRRVCSQESGVDRFEASLSFSFVTRIWPTHVVVDSFFLENVNSCT